MASPDWVAPLLTRLAVPRLPGSAALVHVEAAISERLEALGYAVRREPFSTTPQRLTAAGVAGAGLAGVSAAVIAFLFPWSTVGPATLVLAAAGALGAVALAASALAAGRVSYRGGAVEAVNLVAARGDPALWLVAHSDSKSQWLSLLARVVAATAAVVGAAGLVLVLAARVVLPVPSGVVAALALVGVAGGLALARAAPRNASPGAVDNASGIIAALVAAERLGERGDIGVLVTGAEEFGMEGARQWTARHGPRGMFVNFDGLDGRGPFRVVAHRARRATRKSAEIAAAVRAALEQREQRVRASRLPIGIAVDGGVLAGAGMSGVTVLRGDWRTAAVVHTARDGLARFDPAGAVTAGEAAAAAVRRLLG